MGRGREVSPLAPTTAGSWPFAHAPARWRHAVDRDSTVAGCSMAVGIDCMLISVALAMLTAAPEANKDISAIAYCIEVGAPVMSAGLIA
jgi:hypothetical protein